MAYQHPTSGDTQRSPLDRQPPPVFSSGQPPSFKTNVNRMKTKRWVEAKAPSYDDWGDYDDEYGYGDNLDSPPQSHTQPQPQAGNNNRSFTDPDATTAPPVIPLHRKNSFDAGDDKRSFSSSSAITPNAPTGLNTRDMQANYTSHQHTMSPGTISPSSHFSNPAQPNVQHALSPSQSYQHADKTDALQQQLQHAAGTTGSRQSSAASWTQSVISDGPSIHQEPYQRRDFTPSALPPPLQTRASPAPSEGAGNRFPPRKSSLSQASPTDMTVSSFPPAAAAAIPEPVSIPSTATPRSPINTGKALPIVRPADIYRRMEEEREKERLSIDSSRPSIDSGSSKPAGDVASPKRVQDRRSSESLGRPGVQTSSFERNQDDDEGGVYSRFALEPVAERKSEYILGFPPQAQDPQTLGANVDDERNLPQQGAAVVQMNDQPIKQQDRDDSITLPQSQPTTGHQQSSGLIHSDHKIRLSMPDVDGVSSFGDDFWSSTPLDASKQPNVNAPDKLAVSETEHEPSQPSGQFDIKQTSDGDRVSLPSTHRIQRKPSGRSHDPSNPAVPVSPAQGQADHTPSSIPSALDHTEQHSKPAELLANENTSDATAHGVDIVTRSHQDTTYREADTTANSTSHSLRKELGDVTQETNDHDPYSLTLNKTTSVSGFDTTSGVSLPRSRSASPTKSRVRDLAGKFDDIAESRRNSTYSNSSRKGNDSPTKNDFLSSSGSHEAGKLPSPARDENTKERPAPVRDVSFRPHLPGGWESFTTTVASTSPLETPSEDPSQNIQPVIHSPIPEETSPQLAKAQTELGKDEKSLAGISNDSPMSPQEESPIEHQLTNSSTVATAAHREGQGNKYLDGQTSDTAKGEDSDNKLVVATGQSQASSLDEDSLDTRPPVPVKNASSQFSSTLPIHISDDNTQPVITDPSMMPSNQTLESDRLREEIVRTLDLPDEQSASQQHLSPISDLPEGHRDSSILPAEYASYWAGSDEPATRFSAASNTEPPMQSATRSATGNSTDTNQAETRPQMGEQRFSWQHSSTPDFVQGQTAVTPLSPEAREQQLPTLTTEKEVPPLPNMDQDETYSPPTAATGVSPIASLSPVTQTPITNPTEPHLPNQPLAPVSVEQHVHPTSDATIHPSSHVQPRFPPFREILAMKSSSERIETYNKTREQFATSESGLRNWLKVTLTTRPDLEDVKRDVTQAPPPTASIRHKHTPSLSMFGKGSTPYYQQYIDSASQVPSAANAGLNSPSTAQPPGETTPTTPIGNNRITSQHMQAKGKDFLHSAGVLGGKATISAKGLFTKGKNRFRSSGSDKVPQTPTSRQSSLERPSSGAEKERKHRSLSIASFRRSRSHPSSAILKTDRTSVHSEDTQSEAIYGSKRHSYAGEHWDKSTLELQTSTPKRLGVLPSPAASAFTTSQMNLLRAEGMSSLPRDSSETISQPVIMDSTPDTQEVDRRSLSLETATRGRTSNSSSRPELLPQYDIISSSHALSHQSRLHPQATDQHSGDVSPVEQPGNTHMFIQTSRSAKEEQRSIIQLSSVSGGDVSPMSDGPQDERDQDCQNELTNSPAKSSCSIDKLSQRADDPNLHTDEGATSQWLSRNEGRISHDFDRQAKNDFVPADNIIMHSPDPVPSDFGSNEPKRSSVLQSLSNAVVMPPDAAHKSYLSDGMFAVRVVGSPENEMFERSGRQSSLQSVSDRTSTGEVIVGEDQSSAILVLRESDDDLYADPGEALPITSNQTSIQTSTAAFPSSQIQEHGAKEPLTTVEQHGLPQPRFLNKSNRTSAASVESRPMSFVILPRDADGYAQEQINRASVEQPSVEHENQFPKQHLILTSLKSTEPHHVGEVTSNSRSPEEDSEPEHVRRVYGGSTLLSDTGLLQQRPLEPGLIYGASSFLRGTEESFNQDPPPQHSFDKNSPTFLANPLRSTFHGVTSSNTAGLSPDIKSDTNIVLSDAQRQPSIPSHASLSPPQTAEKEKPRTRVPSSLKSNKRPESISHESEASGVSALTRESLLVSVPDSRLDSLGSAKQWSPPGSSDIEKTQSKTSKSLQRASVSAIAEPQKKKRFSGLGSLFKRSESSGHTPKAPSKFRKAMQNSVMQTVQASPPQKHPGVARQSSVSPSFEQPLDQRSIQPFLPQSSPSAYSSSQRFHESRLRQTGNPQIANSHPLGGYYAPEEWTQGPPIHAIDHGQVVHIRSTDIPPDQLHLSRASPDENTPFASQQPILHSQAVESQSNRPDAHGASSVDDRNSHASFPSSKQKKGSQMRWTAPWRRHSPERTQSLSNGDQQRQQSIDHDSLSHQISGQSQLTPFDSHSSPPVVSPVSSSSSQVGTSPLHHGRAEGLRMNSISETVQHQERPWNISIPVGDNDSHEQSRSRTENSHQWRPQSPQVFVQTSIDPTQVHLRGVSNAKQTESNRSSSHEDPHSNIATSPMQRYREILPCNTPQAFQAHSVSQPRALNPLQTNLTFRHSSTRASHSASNASPSSYPLPLSPGISSPTNPLAVDFPAPPPPGHTHTFKTLEPREGVMELPAQQDSDDDEPVMHAVSYPGMEWAPRWDEF